jgi:mycothiol system anti-sigma-R factor
VSLFESLRRLFGVNGAKSPSGSSGSPQDTAHAMISCDEASARLFEYLDGELEGLSEDEVRRHLEVCKACYPRVQFERHFLQALQRTQNGGRASASLKERVLGSLAEERGSD